MASPSKSGLKTSLCDNPKPHIFETFGPAEDYESFRRYIILPSFVIHMIINMSIIQGNIPFHLQ